jgi:EAL domain-containing protein (putative c-di-GMP-specific phosphodiesterase class I)
VSVQPADVAELRLAIGAGEIVPWYQPIVDLASGTVTGVEALARWQRPGGPVVPAEFIPLAEDAGLVIELDLAVIRRALADLAGWQRLRPGFELNVNVSGRHLDAPTGAADLIAAVASGRVAAGTVCVELTETVRPVTADRGAAGLAALRGAGMSVWLDDFGSGYYNLRDLIGLPVDGFKFDRAFTAQLDLPRTAPLLGALTAAAHRMGLLVTLEGIETAAQASAARDLGCDLGQGYFWSRPVPAAEVPGLLIARPA